MFVNIYEKLTGNFVEEVNLEMLIEAIVDFVKTILKFEFGFDMGNDAE